MIDSEGVPRELKVDNTSAFKSSEFRNFVNDWKIKLSFSMPYVHTPIGLVARNIRTGIREDVPN